MNEDELVVAKKLAARQGPADDGHVHRSVEDGGLQRVLPSLDEPQAQGRMLLTKGGHGAREHVRDGRRTGTKANLATLSAEHLANRALSLP